MYAYFDYSTNISFTLNLVSAIVSQLIDTFMRYIFALELERWLMKMCFTLGLLLLQEHSSVLLWKQELMAFWILQEDPFVTQVKVFSMPSSDSFSPCEVLRYPNYETLLDSQQYTTLQTSIVQILSYQIWKFHLTTDKVFTSASLKGTYKESYQASSYRLLMTETISLNLVKWFMPIDACFTNRSWSTETISIAQLWNLHLWVFLNSSAEI